MLIASAAPDNHADTRDDVGVCESPRTDAPSTTDAKAEQDEETGTSEDLAVVSQRGIFAMWNLSRRSGQIDDLTIASQCVYQPASNGAGMAPPTVPSKGTLTAFDA